MASHKEIPLEKFLLLFDQAASDILSDSEMNGSYRVYKKAQ